MKKLLSFLDRLEEAKIYYRLSKIRDSVMVEIAIPGQRWEVEFMEDDTVQIEKFITTATLCDENELDILFRDFSN